MTCNSIIPSNDIYDFIVVNDVLTKYQKALAASNHDGAEKLATMQKGAKCTFPNFKCPTPCGFALGVTEKRKI